MTPLPGDLGEPLVTPGALGLELLKTTAAHGVAIVPVVRRRREHDTRAALSLQRGGDESARWLGAEPLVLQ